MLKFSMVLLPKLFKAYQLITVKSWCTIYRLVAPVYILMSFIPCEGRLLTWSWSRRPHHCRVHSAGSGPPLESALFLCPVKSQQRKNYIGKLFCWLLFFLQISKLKHLFHNLFFNITKKEILLKYLYTQHSK